MWAFLAFLAIPLIEIGLFVQIGGEIGLWPTIALVIASAALGLVVLRGLALGGLRSLRRDIRELQDPVSPLAHRVMMGIGAILLIIPGFMTDVMGLMLLIPPVRRLILRLASRRLKQRFAGRTGAVVIEGEWREVNAGRTQGDGPSKWTRH